MTRNRIFIRDDRETEVDVDYELESGSEASGLSGPPEDYDPGSAPEVVIVGIWIDGVNVVLTDAERERFDTEVLEDPDTYALDDGPDDY